MKKIFSLVLAAIMVLTLAGCKKADTPGNETGDLPPMINMAGIYYVAPHMPVNELPDGYSYLGELTEEQANDTGLAGCKMYGKTVLDSIPDFYVYQQCGTLINENTVDSEKIQWAYVQWVQCKNQTQ